MNVAQVTKLLSTYVIAEFPGYRQKGRLLHKEPIEYVLRGYFFDRSSAPEALQVALIVMPLYVPDDNVFFSSTLYSALVTPENEVAEMRRVVKAMHKAEATVDRVNDAASVARYEHSRVRGSERAHERHAYSLALAGDRKGAVRSLRSLKKRVARRFADQPAATWLMDIHARAGRLLDALEEDPAIARAMLEEWASQTRAALKLA